MSCLISDSVLYNLVHVSFSLSLFYGFIFIQLPFKLTPRSRWEVTPIEQLNVTFYFRHQRLFKQSLHAIVLYIKYLSPFRFIRDDARHVATT